MVDDEPAHQLVKSLGAHGDVEDPGPWVEDLAGQCGKLRKVIADPCDDLVGHGVAEEGARQAAVERPATQRQEQAVLRRGERRKRDAHVFTGDSLISTLSLSLI